MPNFYILIPEREKKGASTYRTKEKWPSQPVATSLFFWFILQLYL